MDENKFNQFVKFNFPSSSIEYESDYYFFTASPFLSDNIHYEVNDNKIQFHIEGDDWKEIRDFCNTQLENCDELYSQYWMGRKNCCWELKDYVDFDDEDKIGNALLKLYAIINPVIEKFIDYKGLRPKHVDRASPKNELINMLAPTTNNSVERNDEYVRLFTNITLSQVFNTILSIPPYQRIYCWEKNNIDALFRDFREAGESEYHLGCLILHYNIDSGSSYLDIVDGQQRLVTLTILLECLGYIGPLPLLESVFGSSLSRDYIGYNKYLCRNYINRMNSGEKNELCEWLLNKLLFSVLIIDSRRLELAFTFFSNANSKGLPLSDFNLLKAHHLRYIPSEIQQKHLAERWDKFSVYDSDARTDREVLDSALGKHILRLRKWMRAENFSHDQKYIIRDEYVAAPIIPDIPAFGESFYFYEKIQGGAHFFAFSEAMCEEYRNYCNTREHNLLNNYLNKESHWKYMSMIDSLLFGYFLKFGNQYLAKALFAIETSVSIHRYINSRAIWDSIVEYISGKKIIMMLDQATSPTFFLAELLQPVLNGEVPLCENPIQERYKKQVGEIYSQLFYQSAFTDDFIIKEVKKLHESLK